MVDRPWHASYDPSVPRSIEYADRCLTEFLEISAARHPGRDALVFMNCRRTYAQLLDEVQRMAAALKGLGVEPGTRVAVQLPNLPQTVIAYYAVLWLGGEVVLTNPLYTPREIEHQWNDSDCKVAIVTDFNYVQKIRDLRSKLPVQHYVVASIPEYLGFPLNLLAPLKLKRQDPPLVARIPEEQGVHRFRDLVGASQPLTERHRPEMGDTACLQYTGGTTGVSKGAVLSQRNLSVNVQQILAWFGAKDDGPREVMLTCLPLFHSFGMTVGMNWALAMGGTMVLVPNPRDIPALVKNITKHRVTIFPGVPALYNALNNFPGIETKDMSCVKVCLSGSAPLAQDVQRRFEKLTGATIVEGFGLSETSPVTHCNPMRGTHKIGHIGIPFPDTDCKIVDVEDEVTELPFGEEGELCIKGPQVMQGYWDQPEESARALRDGWLHTGDLAAMDEDGFFEIVGRKKEMIIRGGFKIFPDEVDRILMAHEAILEAGTVGKPDGDKGELVVSFLVLQPGASLTEEQVQEYCREQLAPYKIPKRVVFVEELPKSTVMKILRRELVKQAEQLD